MVGTWGEFRAISTRGEDGVWMSGEKRIYSIKTEVTYSLRSVRHRLRATDATWSGHSLASA